MPRVKCIDLSKINYLLHDVDVNDYDVEFDGIIVVSLGAQTPNILKSHSFYYGETTEDDEIGRIMSVYTEIRKVFGLNCKILTQNSCRYVSSKKEAIDILKRGSHVFGVWGKEQYDFFSKFSLNVYDISTPILDEMIKRRSEPLLRKKRFNFCKNMDLSEVRLYLKPKRSITVFFCDLLCSKLAAFKHVPKEIFREVFGKWIENKAWSSIVNAM